jgi:hypothetical protein
MTMHNGDFVTYGRWEEANQALRDRLDALEERSNELRGAEAEHDALSTRITVLETQAKSNIEGERARRGHLWLLVIGLATGVICPLIVTTILAWIHLRSLH